MSQLLCIYNLVMMLNVLDGLEIEYLFMLILYKYLRVIFKIIGQIFKMLLLEFRRIKMQVVKLIIDNNLEVQRSVY